MSKGSAIVGFILCFFAGMVLMWGADQYSGGPGKESATKDTAAEVAEGAAPAGHAGAKVPVTSDDASWGSPTAPVTLVLFSDYQCPFCTRVEPTVAGLKQKYGPGKLRVVWKHFPLPFHKDAMPAHIASQTVFRTSGNDVFWKFHEIVFKNQRNLKPENFEGWVQEAGGDVAKFKAAFASKQYEPDVQKDMSDGKAAGVSGTPASFVNGIFVSGAQPQSAFEAHIDKELAATEQLVGAGTPKEQVYVTRTAANHSAKAAPDAAKQPERAPVEDKTVWKVPVLSTDPYKGAKDALVTIVEFSDYQCPFCTRVLPTLKQLLDTYPGKLKVVWKDQPLPFHKRALPAAILAREALAQKGMEGFWKAHDLLFENQRKLEDEDLFGYAEKLGLNVGKAKAAIAGNKYKELIDECQEIASDFQANGTPHFFINGRRLSGAQPFEKFKEIVDEELKKAEALLQKGVKAAHMYQEVTKDGKAPPPPEMKDAGPAPKDAPFKGGANAKVVIQEFSDFQCPFCSRVNDTIKEIVSTYGKKVKIVWRHKPLAFHQDAPLASQAAVEAYVQKGNKGFWDMHDKIFAGQQQPGLKREALEGYAKELGLDLDKFKKALDSGAHKARVDADNAASDKVGISGTPAFVINGYYLSGAQPFAKFKKLIDRALKEAK